MLQCWNKEDNTRLHMAEIHDKLERWINFPELWKEIIVLLIRSKD